MMRKTLIAKIHIAKQQLGIDEESYRALLLRHGGNSCTALSVEQLEQVIAELKQKGFKPKNIKKQGRARPKVARSREVTLKKIEALLANAGRPWKYADSTANRMFKVQRVEWLDDDQLFRLMQALIIDANRHGKTQ